MKASSQACVLSRQNYLVKHENNLVTYCTFCDIVYATTEMRMVLKKQVNSENGAVLVRIVELWPLFLCKLLDRSVLACGDEWENLLGMGMLLTCSVTFTTTKFMLNIYKLTKTNYNSIV